MIRAIVDCFRPLTPARVVRRQADEAHILHLQHAALAEEHAALAAMYVVRLRRLLRPVVDAELFDPADDPDFREVPRS